MLGARGTVGHKAALYRSNLACSLSQRVSARLAFPSARSGAGGSTFAGTQNFLRKSSVCDRAALLARAQPSDHVAVAEEAVQAAAKVTLKYFRSLLEVETKGNDSPVTVADREAEEAIRQVLRTNCPDHAILGEESGFDWPGQSGHAEYLWVIDPIDGTKSFITGKPLWGTLLALLHKGEPVLGIIDQPYTKERWVGVKGQPTTLNGKELRTKQTKELMAAYLYATSPHMFEEEPCKSAWERLRAGVKIPMYGCDCYAYGLLAAGHADLVAECDMKPYDYLAHVPIIQGAGGIITDWEGGSLKWQMLPSGVWLDTGMPGEVLAAANPELHASALEAMKFEPEGIDEDAMVSYGSVSGPGN